MAGVEAINGSAQQVYTYKNSMGKEDFLKLLICQLQTAGSHGTCQKH